MTSTIEFRVMELLCSRLCHDLISPVMAVNNGMELLAEDSGDMSEDIRDLLTTAAEAAAARLQFYRIAYGLGGMNAPPVGLAEAGRLSRGLVEDGKVEIDWPAGGGATPELGREAMKLLLNMVVLGLESLPRGGRLKLEVQPSGTTEIAVMVQGEGAGLREESASAMALDVDPETLTARSVQGYFVNRLADMLGGEIEAETERPDSLTLRTRFAA